MVCKLAKRKQLIFDLHRKEFSYFLGVIHGDGYINDKPNTGNITVHVCAKDHSYADTLLSLAHSIGWKSAKLNKGKNGGKLFTYCSKNLTEYLVRFKRNRLWYFPEKPGNLLHYIAGLVDTDGSIRKRGLLVRIGQRNNGNLAKIIPFLDELGMLYTFSTWRNNTNEISIKGAQYCVPFLTAMRHPRKLEILKERLAKSTKFEKRNNQILTLIDATGSVSVSELATKLKCLPTTVSYSLKQLRLAGAVTAPIRNGRTMRYARVL
jgi:DNA-binding transcriptional ArsR family regulator